MGQGRSPGQSGDNKVVGWWARGDAGACSNLLESYISPLCPLLLLVAGDCEPVAVGKHLLINGATQWLLNGAK